jgi:type II secretion system protein G
MEQVHFTPNMSLPHSHHVYMLGDHGAQPERRTLDMAPVHAAHRTGIILALALLGRSTSLAISNDVYSFFNSGSTPLTGYHVAVVSTSPIWVVGLHQNKFGIEECSYWTDSTGSPIPWSATRVKQPGDKRHRYTRLCLGQESVSIPLPPLNLALVGFGVLALTCISTTRFTRSRIHGIGELAMKKYLFAVVTGCLGLCLGFALCYVYLVIPQHGATAVDSVNVRNNKGKPVQDTWADNSPPAALPPQQVSDRKQIAAQMIAATTQMFSFKTALDAFRVDTGFYPTGTNALQALVHKPVGTTNWIGPYVTDIPKDPWGHDYVYECPGQHTASGYHYDLFSPGPPGARVPIANWSTPGMSR